MSTTHLDLFSGIGGFALAARWAGWETVGFCEIDPWCRNVIEKHFDSDRWFSVSGFVDGKPFRLGLAGDKEFPWFSPDWLVIENVATDWRKWVPELRRRLYVRGYTSLPIHVRASDFGAPHARDRIYLVANAHGDGESLRAIHAEVAELCASTRFWRDNPDPMGMDDGLSQRMDRLRGLGNAIVPAVAYEIFEAINRSENESSIN